ncbi:MAG: FAD:protein transferase [Chthoniobacteraceae bacterium]|nr:FAD:protein transferase [Chthoniobacteraceae bacterium]
MNISLRKTALLLVALASAWEARGENLTRFAFEKAEMGLPFHITLYAADETVARQSADAAFERIAQLNGVLSDYDSGSELSRLSLSSGQGKAVPVSPDLWRVLECSQALAEKTDGAFDVTVGPLVNTWRRARRKQELPGAELLAEMRSRVGFKNMRLDAALHTVELLKPEMRLDLGAIAKGYAVDEALSVLRRRGIPIALVGGSGDMAAGDPPPDQPGWRIEVAALDLPGAPAAQILFLKNRAIATSGDVFQRLEIGGVRYSHIVDPHTGLGLTDHSLVTIVASNCITADSLATAVSVLGPDRGLKLIEETPDAAAHLVRKPAEKIEFLESSRWKRE